MDTVTESDRNRTRALPGNLMRRVKRHVLAPRHQCCAVVAPGLEKICMAEIRKRLAGVSLLGTHPGQVLFEADIEDIYRANLCLHTPSRILLQTGAFRATRFSVFSRKCRQIPWDLFIRPETKIEIRAQSRHCRLYHGGALAERAAAGINAQLKTTVSKDNAPCQLVFIRGADDHFTLSVDTSGPLLYLRGIKTHGGRAPLRETLAAGILLKAGYRPGQVLVDPMCGSGSFSLEAALMTARLPPGFQREFAFMHWPGFPAARWAFIRQKTLENVRTLETGMIFAADQDADACQKLKAVVDQYPQLAGIRVNPADFFEYGPPARQGLVVLNPPYGRRLDPERPSADEMWRILTHLADHYRGWQMALVTPLKRPRKPASIRWRKARLRHGGLKLWLHYGKIT